MAVTRQDQSSSRPDRQNRRAEDFAVRRWLQLGVASAGVGAALLGYSLIGPQVGVAAADTTAESSASSAPSPSNPDSSEASEADTEAESEHADAKEAEAEDVTDADAEYGTQAEDVTDADADEDVTAEDGGDAAAASGDTEPSDATRHSTRRVTAAPAPQPVTEAPTAAAAVTTAPPTAPSTSEAQPVGGPTAADVDEISWVRRLFFNQAPTVAPVQITGHLSGPVTGTVGAVDPEGDRLVYLLTRRPREGSLQLNADGTYTYAPNSNFDGVDTFRVVAIDTGLHVNLLNPFRGLGTGATALINQGAIKFAFTYTDGGTGWTAERRQALQAAAGELAAYFLVTSPVTLTYEVGLEDVSLASAGSDLISGYQGFHRTVVQNKLLSGIDSNGAAADGYIDWNFAEFQWGLGEAVGPQQYDFVSTALHELLHSFGFLSMVAAAGQNTGRSWTAFDKFVVTAGGGKPIDWLYRWDRDNDAALTGGGDGLFFGGANAVAAYGALVPLLTPDPFEPGSSMSHVDDDTFTGANQMLMNAYSDQGLGVRVLSPVELGILRDLGYHLVPQSPTYAMALIGLVFVRRRPAISR